MSDIDQQIAEFHAAGRRRKAIIFGISGVVLIALGVVCLVISFAATGGGDNGEYSQTTTRYPIKVIVGGIACIIGGISSCYNAYRLASGQINDVDTGDPRH